VGYKLWELTAGVKIPPMPKEADDAGIARAKVSVAACWIVYRHLAIRAKDETGLCYPSLGHISSAENLSRNTVRQALQWLVKAYLIQVETVGGGRKATEYRVLSPVQTVGPLDGAADHGADHDGPQNPSQRVDGSSPNDCVEPSQRLDPNSMNDMQGVHGVGPSSSADAPELGRRFVELVNGKAARQIIRPGSSIGANVATALRHGWTVETLTTHLLVGTEAAKSRGGVVVANLRKIDGRPPLELDHEIADLRRRLAALPSDQQAVMVATFEKHAIPALTSGKATTAHLDALVPALVDCENTVVRTLLFALLTDLETKEDE